MDLLGYAALGGLERLTIVAGAVIIGYWGYRLYSAEKNAGLIFMGLAVLVLVGALATGSNYLKSVTEGYQLASLPAEAPAAETSFAEADAPGEAEAAPDPEPAITVDMPAAAPEAVTADAPEPEVSAPDAAPPAPVEAPIAAEATVPSEETTASESEASPVRIATGAELGGRIVSVKSENVSLEWSSETDESGSGSE
ncbi:MAG: hypothetical protein EP301_10260 [Gammaproteobacteria bacterium]|nr:MAG: hypothetical protein EP301_10260 [Gammaproteobacteria bacterium]